MKKLAISNIVLIFVTLGWSGISLAEQPQPRGELRIVDKSVGNQYNIRLNRLERLVIIDRDGRLVPQLATGWRWLNDSTLEMTLRQGVTFHNGEVFDAEIVKLCWTAIMQIAEYWGRGIIWAAFPAEARLEIIDPYTIRIELPGPEATALVKLSSPYFFIANRQFYTELEQRAKVANKPRVRFYWNTQFSPGPWGTGPYKLVTGVSMSSFNSNQIVMEANRDYWDKTRMPQIQRIVFDHSLTQTDALEQLKTTEGRVDLLTRLRPLDTLRVAESPFGKVIKERTSKRSLLGLLNMRKAGSPWHDVRLRQAINYAINRADLLRYAAAYSTEFCHQFHRKIASQSTGKLPPIPDESCHRKSERSDAELFMDNLMSSLLSMSIHIAPP